MLLKLSKRLQHEIWNRSQRLDSSPENDVELTLKILNHLPTFFFFLTFVNVFVCLKFYILRERERKKLCY